LIGGSTRYRYRARCTCGWAAMEPAVDRREHRLHLLTHVTNEIRPQWSPPLTSMIQGASVTGYRL
jgi:hypothetical protein